jgi:hypothetical protein
MKMCLVIYFIDFSLVSCGYGCGCVFLLIGCLCFFMLG